MKAAVPIASLFLAACSGASSNDAQQSQTEPVPTEPKAPINAVQPLPGTASAAPANSGFLDKAPSGDDARQAPAPGKFPGRKQPLRPAEPDK